MSALGAVHESSLREIPVRNVWYLLLYAWDLARWERSDKVPTEESPYLLGLLASMLVESCRGFLQTQLGRTYKTEQQEIRGVRGRIQFTSSLKRQSFAHGKAYCQFQELNVDSLKNRILRSSLLQLARSTAVLHPDATHQSNLKRQLTTIYHGMDGITVIPLSIALFDRLQLGSNDSDYILPLAICELVQRLSMPGGEDDCARHALFADEERMHHVFESFVRNFYHLHLQPNYVVKRETLQWPDDYGMDSIFVPRMNTDTTIIHRESKRRLVIDTKYSLDTLSSRDKFKSDNLYQLYAYLRTQEHRGDEYRSTSGMLLYPAVREAVDAEMFVQGHRIRIATIDLSKDWKDVERDLLGLVEEDW
ncbi:MAG TPA: hypothetical protein V6D22_10290 [Candidatus Obscuribacterales bacterium]